MISIQPSRDANGLDVDWVDDPTRRNAQRSSAAHTVEKIGMHTVLVNARETHSRLFPNKRHSIPHLADRDESVAVKGAL